MCMIAFRELDSNNIYTNVYLSETDARILI